MKTKLIMGSTTLTVLFALAVLAQAFVVVPPAHATIGGGGYSDWLAFTPGTYSAATGSFTSELNYQSESDSSYGSGSYSLQLNTNSLPYCQVQGNGNVWSNCWFHALYQTETVFPYVTHVFVEFWITGTPACPQPTNTPYIFLRSGAQCVAAVAVANASHDDPQFLNGASLSISATSATITVKYCGHTTGCVSGSVTNVFGTWFTNGWDVAEFNAFGYANGSTANFAPTSGQRLSLGISISTSNSGTSISCLNGVTNTAELNNLNLGSCSATYNFNISYSEHT